MSRGVTGTKQNVKLDWLLTKQYVKLDWLKKKQNVKRDWLLTRADRRHEAIKRNATAKTSKVSTDSVR